MNKSRNDLLLKLAQASPLLAAIGEEKSFTKAAERLNVQQSAVSHRIRALEEALGLTLFERTTRSLRFTEAGKILCSAAIESMSAWQPALDKLERSDSSGSIRLSLPSSLAMKWAVSILPKANAEGLAISLEVRDDLVDLHQGEADVAIRFGVGPYPGLYSIRLAQCQLQPVASPAFLERHPILRSTDNDEKGLLATDIPLLSDRRGEVDSTEFSWHHYFSQIESTVDRRAPRHQFDRADLMLQAAISGMGIALGRTLLIESDLEAGFLEKVGPPVSMQSSYWLVCSASFAETKRFERLRRWLSAEIKKINTTGRYE